MLSDPGGRAPAPEPLRLVQAFVNTLDIENGVEELTTSESLHATLVRIGTLSADEGPLDDYALATALAVREGIRALALANSGLAVSSADVRPLEAAAAAARFAVRFEPADGPRLVPRAPGIDGALGRILAVVHEATVDGSWARLKGCPREVCHWLFYDRSRNGSGKWCAMSVCGNRTNTKAYRRRLSA